MNNKNRLLFLLLSVLSGGVCAKMDNQLQYPSPFVGIKGGHQWAQDDAYPHSTPQGGIFGVHGGLQLSPTWSWDLGYQYHDDLKADVTSVNVKTWLVESALRHDWYLQDSLSLYGRLGAAYWDINKTSHASDILHATGVSPLGEVGVNYQITPDLRVSAGYQYIYSIGKSNTGEYDSHALLVGVAYNFAGTAQATVVETL